MGGKRGKKNDEYKGGKGSENRGRKLEHDDWRGGGNGKGKKKPDMEPYVPKKIQEQREGKSEDPNGKSDTLKKEDNGSTGNNSNNKDGGSGNTNTNSKRKKKNRKNK